MANKKVVLAYSGGLDTSVAIKWLQEKGYDVIALGLDVGEGKDLDFVKEKALLVGAVESISLDVKKNLHRSLSFRLFKVMQCMKENTRCFLRYPDR